MSIAPTDRELLSGPRVENLPGWPHYDADEVEAASSVLRSGRVNFHTGGECKAFEREYADYLGCAKTIAISNGTVTLEIALRGLGIGPGDEVVVTPRSFMASASTIAMSGATPVFADIDRDTQNLTAETVEAVLTPRTRAVMVVHLAGWPAELDELAALCCDRGLDLIEDCAQAHGAMYKGRHVGTFGRIGSWSFCQDKIMTTGGEGGLLNMDDEELWNRCWSLKDHGKSFEATYHRQHPPGYRWLHESFGTNGRLTEFQAAIGRLQLRKLEEWRAKREANAKTLAHVLEGHPLVRIPMPPAHVRHAWYKFYAFLEPSGLADGWTRERITEEISSRGVPCIAGSCSELYLEKAFVTAGIGPRERLPVARELGETAMMFQVHPTLTPAHMEEAGAVVRWVLDEALR